MTQYLCRSFNRVISRYGPSSFGCNGRMHSTAGPTKARNPRIAKLESNRTSKIYCRYAYKGRIKYKHLSWIAKYLLFTDSNAIFSGTPSWMSLKAAHHFLQLSIASYGWLFVIYQHVCTGCFRLIRGMTCCACFR